MVQEKKTAEEWFQLLPKTIRKKAINNIKSYSRNCLFSTLREALEGSFVWAWTKEKHTEWNRVLSHCDLYSYNSRRTFYYQYGHK